MNLHAPKPNKYKAYRDRKKAAGLKQVRIWALDPDAPGFRDAVAAALERERSLEGDEADAIQEFLDDAAEDTWGKLP